MSSSRGTGTTSEEGTPARRFPVAVLIAVAGVTLLLGVGLGLSARRPPEVAAAAISEPALALQRCAECHSDITEVFPTAPHARTLRRATDAEAVERFAGKTFRRETPEVTYDYEMRDGQLWVSSSGYGREVPLTWLFGSGTHAQTPVITWTTPQGGSAAIEHGVSWYPDHGLDVTLGTDHQQQMVGSFSLGRPWGTPETIACFECHSTHVPVEGNQIQFEQLHATIGCNRCHWDTAEHVAEMDRGGPTTIERFSRMDPREAVDRCGECHRRADELNQSEVTRDNASIARFAPVGLVQSPCFLQQEEIRTADGERSRMDCASCHDPHRPAESDWQFYAAICLDCHHAGEKAAQPCGFAHPEPWQSQNCLPCHMPKVQVHPLLRFTDHWIRVREVPAEGGATAAEAGSGGAAGGT